MEGLCFALCLLALFRCNLWWGWSRVVLCSRDEEGEGRIGGIIVWNCAGGVSKSGPPWLVGYDGTI